MILSLLFKQSLKFTILNYDFDLECLSENNEEQIVVRGRLGESGFLLVENGALLLEEIE